MAQNCIRCGRGMLSKDSFCSDCENEIDDMADDFDDGEVPCEICGQINGMENPCCINYDPLNFKVVGYG